MSTEESPLVQPVKPGASEAYRYEWRKFNEDFKQLKAGPRSLWLMYLIAFLYGFGFFLAAIVVVLLLTEVFNVSDLEAGIVYGAMGVTFALAAVLEGSVPDKFGIRICFLIAGVLMGFSCIVVGVAPNAYVAIFGVLVLMPIGGGLGIPVTKVGVKKYTLPHLRSTAFSLLYVVVHGASAFAAVLVDLVLTSTDSIAGISVYRWCLFIGAIISFTTSGLAYFLQDMDYEETAEGVPNTYHEEAEYWSLLDRVASRHSFKVLIAVVLILVCVKSAYRQLDVTFPRYMRREMGNGAHFGLVLSVHPFILVIAAVLFTPLAYVMSPYNIMIIGSIISGLGCFILLLGANYITCLAFIIVISLGEGMWNPRLYDYTLSLSPKGMEGTFMALASSPLFLSMILAGVMSGLLMWTMCGSQCGVMWVIIGCVALITPMLLFLLRKWLKLDPKFLDMPRQ